MAAASSSSEAAAAPQAQATEGKDAKDADVKIILLGDSAVGKSKLVERFLLDNFTPRLNSTYALTVFGYETTVNGEQVLVEFWDTAGQERFASMHPSYYFRAHACILLFDVTRKSTYQNLQGWYKELRQYRPGIPVLVVANKIDINYEVTKKKFNFPIKRNLPFFFASAADGTNVVKVFTEAIQAAVDCKQYPPEDFIEDVMQTIDYFEEKDRAALKEQEEQRRKEVERRRQKEKEQLEALQRQQEAPKQ